VGFSFSVVLWVTITQFHSNYGDSLTWTKQFDFCGSLLQNRIEASILSKMQETLKEMNKDTFESQHVWNMLGGIGLLP